MILYISPFVVDSFTSNIADKFNKKEKRYKNKKNAAFPVSLTENLTN